MEMDVEKIEAYLDNALSTEESRVFEAKMASDDLFRQEVAAHKAVREAIVDHELMALKAGIREFMDHQPPPGGGIGRNGRAALGIGGALIVGLSTWWLLSPAPPSMTQSDPQPPAVYDPNPTVSLEETTPKELPVAGQTNVTPREQTQRPAVSTSPEDIGSNPVLGPNEEPGEENPVQEEKENAPLPRLVPKRTPVEEMPIRATETIEIAPVPSASKEDDDCFLRGINEPFIVQDGCKSGLIEIDDKWVLGARSGQWDIALLPGPVRLLEGTVTNLKPGVYTFLISGKDNCQWSKAFTITGSECAEKRKAFSPFLGEKWIFQVPGEIQGQVDIVNKSGALVKKLQFGPGEEVFWDGFVTTGNLAPMGVYFYVITDRMGQEVDRGTIHLVR